MYYADISIKKQYYYSPMMHKRSPIFLFLINRRKMNDPEKDRMISTRRYHTRFQPAASGKQRYISTKHILIPQISRGHADTFGMTLTYSTPWQAVGTTCVVKIKAWSILKLSRWLPSWSPAHHSSTNRLIITMLTPCLLVICIHNMNMYKPSQ